MTRYHINPATGDPGVCRATTSCPFGDMETDHFGSKDEARAAAEKRLASEYTPDLTKESPLSIDSALAELYSEQIRVMELEKSREQALERTVRRLRGLGYRGKVTPEIIEEAVKECREMAKRTHVESEVIAAYDRLVAVRDELNSIIVAQKPYHDEYRRRGGWTRAFLVTNGNGHVHKSMHCSTCRPTTVYHWVTEYSGKTQNEVVEAAGERACTVCYPDAPVSVLSRASKIFSPDEKQKIKDREARAAAKAEKDQKRIANALTADGSEFVVEHDPYGNGRVNKERFKTERAATTWLVDELSAPHTWRSTPLSPSTLEAIDQVKEALAAKHGKTMKEIDAMLEPKIKAKIKRYNS